MPGPEGAIAGWSNDGHLFSVVPGNRYRIQGYMRGVGIDLSRSPAIGIRLDVYGASPGAPAGGFIQRDKSYLRCKLMKHLQFGIDNQVPMSVMEFGVVRQAFQMEGKGGDRWVSDMLSLFRENNLSFAYWEYHGPQMGLYLSGTGLPGEPHTALQDALTHRGLRSAARDRSGALLQCRRCRCARVAGVPGRRPR